MMTTPRFARAGYGRVREERNGADGYRSDVPNRRRFALGRLFATPVALTAIGRLRAAGKPYSVQREASDANNLELVMPFVNRHAAGDWGDVDAADWQANDEALENGERLMSAYNLGDGTRLWILTEADRSATTVILASEY